MFIVLCLGCGKAEESERTQREREYIAPRDSSEVRMVKLWESVLDVHPIGIRDNFFGLGGHSIAAAELFSEIEKSTDKAFPPATIFEAPTVEQLADIFRREDWSPQWKCLVPIQSEGDKRPMFFVHPMGGDIFGYADLARRLGRNQPFYGLQAIGLDGNRPPLDRVEDMAAHYLEEVKSVCPEGPYRLGGRCAIGGLVAYEMAQQLLAQGEDVELLAMIDVRTAPTLRAEESDPNRQRPSSRNPRRNTQRWLGKISSLLEDPQSRRFKEVKAANDQAYNEYVPKPFPGHVSFFISEKQWARKPYRFLPDSPAGWQNLALGGLKLNLIPGDHRTMMEEPLVEVMAEKLKACLDKAPGGE